MDRELLDCLTSFPARTASRRSRPAGARASLGYQGAAAADSFDGESLLALAHSLPADVLKACARRAEKHALQAEDVSDPCVCGEALLLSAAAAMEAGRAPLSAYRSLEEWA